MMKVCIGQIYIKPGISFPFSHRFQISLGERLTTIVQPSPDFVRAYGDDFTLMLRMSAKTEIREVEVKGPTVFKDEKDVEYTIFLPYNTIKESGDVIASALRHLLIGIVTTLHALKLDAEELSKQAETFVKEVCADPTMIK